MRMLKFLERLRRDAPSPVQHASAETREAPPSPSTATDADGVRRVVNADVQRERRIPPGQSKAKKWPVLQYGEVPRVDTATWQLRVFGAVEREITLSWDALNALPRIRVHADMHCVTTWTVLDQHWEGVSIHDVLELAEVRDDARFLVAWGADRVGSSERYSTNMPLVDALSPDVLLATHCNGKPLTPEHGGPIRLVVPLLYAWKSAKWVEGLELLTDDRAGFWERNGYHDHGDPWIEERMR